MDVLEQLRSDMDDAGQEAQRARKNETLACLVILDEFIGEHEVVEVVNCLDESYKPPHRRWDEWPVMGRRAIAILVPRERKPSLLEAAAEAGYEAIRASHPDAGFLSGDIVPWDELAEDAKENCCTFARTVLERGKSNA